MMMMLWPLLIYLNIFCQICLNIFVKYFVNFFQIFSIFTENLILLLYLFHCKSLKFGDNDFLLFLVALPSASLTSLRLAVYNTLSRKEVEKLCFDYGFFPSWIPNIENFPCTSNVAYLQIFTFKQIWPCFTKDLMITSTFWENILSSFVDFVNSNSICVMRRRVQIFWGIQNKIFQSFNPIWSTCIEKDVF